jgi:hypothetical protein
MPNILDQIATGRLPLADDLHAAICRTCEELAGDDEAKRSALHQSLVAIIAKALLGECGRPLTYDPRFIAAYVSGVRGARM